MITDVNKHYVWAHKTRVFIFSYKNIWFIKKNILNLQLLS